MSIDFSRTTDFIDVELLQRSTVAVVGVGGASSIVTDLCRVGVGSFILIDPDVVEGTNIATQNYYERDIGDLKVRALERECYGINRNVHIQTHAVKYEGLDKHELRAVWDAADLVYAMTDSQACQIRVARDAESMGAKTPVIYGAVYSDMSAVELVHTCKRTVACLNCVTLSRIQAYAEGFTMPETSPSYLLPGRYVNALAAQLGCSIVHDQANSDRPIADVVREIGTANFMLGKIDPSHGIDTGTFDTRTPYSVRTWEPDSPLGWTCPNCQRPGTIPEIAHVI